MATRKKAATAAPIQLRVTQVRSGIGRPGLHRRTLAALGLKHQRTVMHEDNAAIRGMLYQVRHLVQVEELAAGEES